MEKHQFRISDLQQKVEQAVIEFMRKDAPLLKLKAHEQAISHRIAYYLENQFSESEKNEINVDCEYNKDLGSSKEFNPALDDLSDDLSKDEYRHCKCYGCKWIRKNMADKYPRKKRFRPDALVHLRGKDHPNLIAIEIKKNKQCLFDEEKLKALTKENGRYKYKLGVFIYFRKRVAKLLPFLNGRRCSVGEKFLQVDSTGSYVWTLTCFVENNVFGVAATPPSPEILRHFPENAGCDEASQPPFGHHFYKATLTSNNQSLGD